MEIMKHEVLNQARQVPDSKLSFQSVHLDLDLLVSGRGDSMQDSVT